MECPPGARGDVYPVVEIFPEVVVLDLLLQILVGRGDNPGVHGLLLMTSDPSDLLLLQSSEELDLHGERHLTDLVEKQATLVGLAKKPLLLTDRTGKGPPLVTKELTLEQVFRQGSTVDRKKAVRRAWALIVDGPCDQLLAGPALAFEQHRGVGLGYPFDQGENLLHRTAAPDDVGELVLLLELAA
jgi:hypothetical protein